MRKAEELSTTVAPARTATGANCREMALPAEKRAMSMPSKLRSVSASTSISAPLERHALAGGAGGGEQAEAGKGKAPPLEAADELGADGTGGADDGDGRAVGLRTGS